MKDSGKKYLESLPPSIITHIEHLERMRRDFVANVSHELRTPLTVIRGYLELLLGQEHTETKPWKKIFTQMYQHSLRMESLIEELLLLSRLENDEQEVENQKNIVISDMLEIICDDARSLSGKKGHIIELKADTKLLLTGAEEELKSLFSNIIFNAVKYTPAKGKINVDWYLKEKQAIFCVKDTGIGIEEKDIPRLTERFYRVDKARSRESGGTGLGLAIVKHVLIRHHGELHIESTLGKGSIFTCIFPVERTSCYIKD